ncbi:hypothetical protein ACFYV7_22160 [Nocardia suismassiliense]|uniref:Secreted protein n=1 Tax=Nocardia suismassiliense TaxID=2077092 RepID=A0ABW6QXA6_9NOCA|nr:hypothetical protein [Nocardia sp. XZ_19_369]
MVSKLISTVAVAGALLAMPAVAGLASAYPGGNNPHGPYDTFESCNTDRWSADREVNGVVYDCYVGDGSNGTISGKYYFTIMWH